MGNEKDGPAFNAALAIPIPDTVSWSASCGEGRWAGDELQGLLDCALQHHQGGPMTLAVSLYFGLDDERNQETAGRTNDQQSMDPDDQRQEVPGR